MTRVLVSAVQMTDLLIFNFHTANVFLLLVAHFLSIVQVDHDIL